MHKELLFYGAQEERLSELYCACFVCQLCTAHTSDQFLVLWVFQPRFLCDSYFPTFLCICLFVFCVGFCFLSTSQDISWEGHLRNGPFCVESHIKPKLSQLRSCWRLSWGYILHSFVSWMTGNDICSIQKPMI